MISKCWKQIKSERAQAMVEFALVFPIFLFIVLFILDAGWVAVQRTAFDNGFMHATWTISASQVGDHVLLSSVEGEQERTYNEGVADALAANIQESNIWGLFSENLSVPTASARCYNRVETFSVPGSSSDVELEASSVTRYMDLNARITYDIFPLTFVGRAIMGSRIRLEKEYDTTKVLKSEQRTG